MFIARSFPLLDRQGFKYKSASLIPELILTDRVEIILTVRVTWNYLLESPGVLVESNFLDAVNAEHKSKL